MAVLGRAFGSVAGRKTVALPSRRCCFVAVQRAILHRPLLASFSRIVASFWAAIALAVITAAAPAHAQNSKPVVNPYGQYLAGDGLKMGIATYLEKNQHGLNDMLVRVTGAVAYEAGIDGKTLRYSAEPAGTGYNLKREGRNLLSVHSSHGRWQRCIWQAALTRSRPVKTWQSG